MIDRARTIEKPKRIFVESFMLSAVPNRIHGPGPFIDIYS